MAVFRLLTIQSPTTTGTVSYAHNMGVVPKAAIAITSRVPTLDSRTQGAIETIGFYDGSSGVTYSFDSVFKTASTSVRITTSTNHIIYSFYGNDNSLLAGTIAGWDSSTVSIAWSSVLSSAQHVNVLLIGGDNVQAKLISFNSPTATGTQTVSGVGFQPDVVLFLAAFTTILGFGVAGRGSGQFGTSIFSAHNVTTTTTRGYQHSRAITVVDTAIRLQAEVTGFTSDGFTLSWSNVQSTSVPVYALCLKGPLIRVGSFLYNAAGSQSVTGIGFQPRCLLLTTVWRATTGSASAPASRSIGLATNANVGSVSIWDRNNKTLSSTATSEPYRLGSTQRILHDNSGTTRYATLTSIDSNGFTVNWSTTPSVSNTIVWYAALGAQSAAYLLNAETSAYGSTGSAAATISDRVVSADSTAYVQAGINPRDEWAARADPGIQALTGSAATFGLGVRFPAESGLHGLTGNRTTIDLERAAGPGLYAALGTAIATDRAIGLDLGTYTLTGADVEFPGERALSAASGSYVLSGQYASLLGNFLARSDPGFYDADGRGARLTTERALAATKDDLALTGLDSSLARQLALAATKNGFVLAGVDSSLTRQLALAAYHDSYGTTNTIAAVDLTAHALIIPYIVTGSDAHSDRVTRADRGVYIVDGQQAELLRALIARLGLGVYDASGQELGAERERLLGLEKNAFAITGESASLARQLDLVADQESYGAAGALLAVDIAANAVAIPYTITGAELISERGEVVMEADYGLYALSGQQAALLSHLVAHHDPGIYGLSGQALAAVAARIMRTEKGDFVVLGEHAAVARAFTLVAAATAYGSTDTPIAVDLTAHAIVIPYTLVGVASTGTREAAWWADAGIYSIQGVGFGVKRFAPRRSLLPRRGVIPGWLRRRIVLRPHRRDDDVDDVITYKEHDNAPALHVTIAWGDDSRVNLAGATVVFSMRDASRDRIVIYRRPVTIVDAMQGQLEVRWEDNDFAEPGDYEAEFEVTLANGEILTFPSSGYIRIRVEPDLG